MNRKQVVTPTAARPLRPARPKQGDIVSVELQVAGKHYALVVSPTELIDLSGEITVLPISTVRAADREKGLTVPLEPGAHSITGVVLCHIPQTFRVNDPKLVKVGSTSKAMLDAARIAFAGFMGLADLIDPA
jgi:mRNA-degrading endonuclease toxin of MazEF toxin-antitoxin module